MCWVDSLWHVHIVAEAWLNEDKNKLSSVNFFFKLGILCFTFFFQLLPALVSFYMVTAFTFILCTPVRIGIDHLIGAFIGIRMSFLEIM